MTKDEIVRAIRMERRSTLALLRELDPQLFDTPTALPGWRIREVAAHLITTDRASVLGTILPVALGAKSTDRLEAWNEHNVPKWANRPVPQLLTGLDRWGSRLATVARAIPGPLYRLRLPTPWGRVPGIVAIWVRAYDEWVHRQDIRRALALADEEVDVEAAAEFLLTAVGSGVVPELVGHRGRVAISLAGVPIPEWEYDLERGTAGPRTSSGVDTRISAPAPAFIMAAAGRDPFDDLQSRSVLRIEGDVGLALTLLSILRIV